MEGSAPRPGPPRQHGPWYSRERERVLFEWHGRKVPGLRRCTEPVRGRVYQLSITVDFYDVERDVEIVFEGYSVAPKVYADGPDSPHRYEDNALCMWDPRDSIENRWELRDGLLTLIGHIRLHLFREEYWREFGVWLGPEASHSEASKAQLPERAA
jgi:hypothetical protein